MFNNYKYYTDNKSKVIAVSTYAGKPVKGVAKCSPDDQFDLDDGKALAAARCNVKVAIKRRERALKKYNEYTEKYLKMMEKMNDVCDYLKNADEALKKAEKHLDNLESRF